MFGGLLRRSGAVLVLSVVAIPIACVCQTPTLQFQGYITAVKPPLGFEINGQAITTSPETSYGLIGGKSTETNSPLPQRYVQIGEYVEASVPTDRHGRPGPAATVLFLNEERLHFAGAGVITRVITPGAEPVYEADGYRVRITSGTDQTFRGELNSLKDIAAGVWVSFEGERGSDGVVTATKAAFFRMKLKPGRSKNGKNEGDFAFEPPGPEGGVPGGKEKDGRVQLGVMGQWHVVPADPELEARLKRIGERIVPQYQKNLPDGDPMKLNFRFYAVVAPKNDLPILFSQGLILIPTHILPRLANDDQVAAVLADSVSVLLQQQLVNAKLYEAVGYADLLNPSVLGAVQAIGSFSAAHEANQVQEERRGRMALALMADGGFDPWQAPEAWRLLASKKPAKKSQELRYPDLAGYQLGILNLEYRKVPEQPEAAQ